MSDEARDDKTQSITVLAPGALISQYKLTKQLGVGGMGEVYLAVDTRLQRDVALKFLSPDFASDDSFRRRFMREAQTAARLNHPNVVTIYDVADHDGRIYIAMEAVEGRELRGIMDEGSMPLEQAVEISVQVCDGLGAAHAAGLVHRDIKPANVLIDSSRRVRILDFGLAKATDTADSQLTQVGQAVGTVHYMSPEQSQGKEIDQRSDIFSTGILLYEMITGQLPFKRNNAPATIHAIVHDQHPPPTKFVPGLPLRLETIVDRALAKDPGMRYQDIREMADALREFGGIDRAQQSGISGVRDALPSQSLAVLHLQNLGSDKDEFLSYGITEDLIVDLTRLGTIRVMPMRAILKYKDSDEDIEAIAHHLNVGLILDGSIHKTGDRVRVSVQLVNVNSGDNLWAERWEEPADNLPQIKSALADGVGKALHVGTTVVRDAQVGAPEAEDAEAYEYYLKGKYTFDKKEDKADVEIALGLYRQALKAEPSLLAARAGAAEVLMHLGQLNDAHLELESALEQAEERSLAADRAGLLRLMARLHIKQSEWDDAWMYAEQSLELCRELNDVVGEAETLSTQIQILQPQARYEETHELFDRVLEISRQLGDEEKVAEALKNMGVSYSRQGDYDRALDLYGEALELARAQGNLSLQAACYSNIGNVHYFQAEIDQALKNYKEALEINHRLGDKAGAARQNLNTGLVQLQQGSHREALEMFEVAAKAFDTLGDRSNYSLTLCNISQLTLTLGESDRASETATKALEISREAQHPLTECAALHRLGSVCFYERELDEAITHFEDALEIAEANKMTRNETHLHLDLAGVYLHKKQNKLCRRHLKLSKTVAREIGEKPALNMVEAYEAVLTVREGLYNMGIRQLKQLRNRNRDSNDPEAQLILDTLLGEALCQGPESDRADGKAVLEAALATARQREIQPQVRMINEALDKHCR